MSFNEKIEFQIQRVANNVVPLYYIFTCYFPNNMFIRNNNNNNRISKKSFSWVKIHNLQDRRN